MRLIHKRRGLWIVCVNDDGQIKSDHARTRERAIEKAKKLFSISEETLQVFP